MLDNTHGPVYIEYCIFFCLIPIHPDTLTYITPGRDQRSAHTPLHAVNVYFEAFITTCWGLCLASQPQNGASKLGSSSEQSPLQEATATHVADSALNGEHPLEQHPPAAVNQRRHAGRAGHAGQLARRARCSIARCPYAAQRTGRRTCGRGNGSRRGRACDCWPWFSRQHRGPVARAGLAAQRSTSPQVRTFPLSGTPRARYNTSPRHPFVLHVPAR